MGLAPVPETISEERRAQYIYQCWIKELPEGDRLLVFDDVADYGEIRPLLPNDNRFRVLITTRERLGSPVQRLDLEVLSRAASFRLLRRLVDGDRRIAAEVESAKQLCEWVGRLPLGIELIGRYLASTPTVKLARLLERLEGQRLQAIALKTVPSEMPYRDNLEAAFELSWRLLDEDAQRVGCLLSGFALAPIDKDWVVAALGDEDEERVERAEATLLQKSMLSVKEGRYSLHALIREFMQRKLDVVGDGDRLKRGIAGAMVAVAQQVPQALTIEQVPRFAVAVPHWEKVATELLKWVEDESLIWAFIGLGRFLSGGLLGRWWQWPSRYHRLSRLSKFLGLQWQSPIGKK